MKVPMKIHNTAESMSARGFFSVYVEIYTFMEVLLDSERK